jgi:hypothetical protein
MIQFSDVLRVEGSVTGVFNAVRNKQVGFESTSPYRMIHKLADGTTHHWTSDEEEVISATDVEYSNPMQPALGNVGVTLDFLMGITGQFGPQGATGASAALNDENVSVSISYAPSLTNQEMVNQFLLRPPLSVTYFYHDQGSSIEKGQTDIGAIGTNPVEATFGLTGAITNWWLRDNYGTGVTGTSSTGNNAFEYNPYLTPSGRYTHTLTATDIANTNVTSNVYIDFKLKKYYGSSVSPTIDETAIETGTAALMVDTS